MSLVKSANPAAQTSKPFRFLGRPSTQAVHQETTAARHANPSADASESDLRPARPSPDPQRSIAKESHFLDRIKDLENALEAQGEELQRAKSQAYEDGLKAGIEASQVQSQEALTLLREALEGCSVTLSAKLDSRIDVSLALATAIVQRILGDEERLPEHVLKTALRWKDELAATCIIELRVSAADFPDSDALAELQNAFSPLQVVADERMRQGACVFDLKLGSLDASISRQVQNAAAFLEAAVETDGQAL